GIKAEIGKDIHITSDATISGTASGEHLNGNIQVKGTELNVKDDGSIDLKVNNTKANGSFITPNHKVTIGGKVNGDVNVKMDPKGTVEVQTKNGNFDAKF